MSEPYEFEGLPLADIRPGTSVLLAGPAHAGTRELGLRMLAGGAGEGAIAVTTNQRAERLVEDCERFDVDVGTDRTAILDCVGECDQSVPARILPVSGPSDLTGISMRYSDVYREFANADRDRVRTGLYSVSTLLSFGDLRAVSRFVHTLVGRIDGVDGVGILLVDPTTHDRSTVNTLAQFCAGRIEVREAESGPELRATGLPDHSRDWTRFDPAPD